MTRGRLARIGRVLLLPASADATPVRPRSPADVLALQEAEAARVRADLTADPVARARAVGALARVTWPQSRPIRSPPGWRRSRPYPPGGAPRDRRPPRPPL